MECDRRFKCSLHGNASNHDHKKNCGKDSTYNTNVTVHRQVYFISCGKQPVAISPIELLGRPNPRLPCDSVISNFLSNIRPMRTIVQIELAGPVKPSYALRIYSETIWAVMGYPMKMPPSC
jgi:hypothetical protein